MIAITAANGHLGQAVAAELLARNAASRVRLAVRSTEKLQTQQDQGFEVVRADYDDPASLDAALAGVSTLLLISSNGTNEDRIRQHKTAIDAARRAGVARIVYTSFTNPSFDSAFVWAHPHAETEPYLKDSGLAWTILRNNRYFTNIDPMLEQAVQKGTFAIPGASGKVAYAGHDDLAAAAATVLLQDGHAGKTYELTGRNESASHDGP
ncbi:NAD(P)H-binding protein [Xanthomonas euvesicatoria pv. alangii]|uniref:NAD(P)H-binding protein n=1 Tax=Xanthomonas euvesicatoria TaxID=456327 RepID=UPI001C471B96|nr:NAD(P)H-binding protein [Xanthomonas euvesicatoria]MBV6670059.1 NAD(P)H-binding protein [Xanthomonas euvesicatoria pv. alangii]